MAESKKKSTLTLQEKATKVKEILDRQKSNMLKTQMNKTMEDATAPVSHREYTATTPTAAKTTVKNLNRPYTTTAAQQQENLPFIERSALGQFETVNNSTKMNSELVTPEIRNATSNYYSNLNRYLDAWKSQRPASYQEASASGQYTEDELKQLAGNGSKANILAQDEWDRTQRNAGQYDSWENVLNSPETVSDDYLKYIKDTVIPQNISAVDEYNAQANASLYDAEIAGDQNRAIIEAVTDIYQRGGENANAKDRALVRQVFGEKLTDSEVSAILSQIHNDPETFLEKSLTDTTSMETPYNNSASAYEQLGEDISSELANREAYNTLMAEAQSSPTYEQDKVFKPVEAGYSSSNKQDNMDNLYMWLNDTAYRSEYNIRHADGIQYFKERGYDYMTEDELAGFNAAYSNGYESAERYLSSLESTGVLNRRRAEAQAYNYTNVAENYPVLSKTVTFGTTAANAAVAPVQLVAAATGLETDPNSSLYDLNRFNTTVRGTVNQMANDSSVIWGFVDNVLTSVIDNVIATRMSLGLTGAVGLTGETAQKWATGLTQSIMSSNSASSALYESLQSGDDQTTAVMKAIASGGIEALTEKYSIETLLGDPTSAWKYLAKNFIAEGSEEIMSDVLNPIADAFIAGITGSKTDMEKEYNNYLLQGYSKKEASVMVMQNYAKEILYDGLAGAFAGGLGASTFIASNAYQGSQMKKSGTGTELVQIARDMPEGSKSRKYAEAVERTGSNYSTAQLYAALSEEMPDVSQDTLDNITAGSLSRQLQSEGEEGDTDAIARSMMKVLKNQELTNEERNALVSSSKGIELMNTISAVSERDSAEMKAYNEAYNAGYYGRESTQTMNQAYYQAGVKDAQTAEQKRLANVGKGKAGNGSVSYIGSVMTTDSISTKNASTLDANTMARLDTQQQDAVSAIQQIAQAIPTINYVLYESQADDTGTITAPNGKYEPSTNTLYIDLNSGKNRSGQGVVEYTVMQTVAHELTHYMETNSAKGYAAYKSLVRETLEARGQDFDALVNQKLRVAEQNGVSLTKDAAVYEVVADASEMMLKDTKALQQLAKQNRSLAQKVKSFVQDVLSKIRKALGKATARHPEAQALMEAGQYVAGLQQAWDNALVEAVETVKGGETGETWNGIPVVESFSLRNAVEKKGELIAVHNLNESKLLDTMQLGGFPMPSIAIVKAETGHNDFGNISVVFSAETIDPQADKSNRVYGNDAWTPTFPAVEQEIDSKVLFGQRANGKALLESIDEHLADRNSQFYNQFVGRNESNAPVDAIIQQAWENEGILAEYLTERGEAISIPQKEVASAMDYDVTRADVYDKILETVGREDLQSMSGKELLETYGEALSAADVKLARLYSSYQSGKFMARTTLMKWLAEALKYDKAGRVRTQSTTVANDYAAAEKSMKAQIDRADFSTWMQTKLDSMLGEKALYNGKERYTASGRRSFKQTHVAYTAENVVRLMKKEAESDVWSTSDAKGIMGASAKTYNSLNAIREDSGRLKQIDETQYKAILDQANSDLQEFFADIDAEGYVQQEEAGALLAQAGRKKLNAQAIESLFRTNGYSQITEGNAKLARMVLDELQNIPTGYFEAKPRRVVGFEEIRSVLVPRGASAKLTAALQERSIPYETYTNEADRLAKLNSVEDAKFSLRDEHYDFSKSFAEQIEDWENGVFPAKDALLVGRTPELYRKIGLGDLPLTINQQHVDYIINGTKDSDHFLGKEWLKKLPEMMNDPLAVIQSESSTTNSVVVLLDSEIDGKRVIAPVYINSESKQNGVVIDSNNIASAFGKENAVTKLLANALQKENAPGQGVGIYYWKKSEARSLLSDAGLQLPGISVQDGLIHSIFDAGSDVNSKMFTSQIETRQFKRWFKNSEVVDDEGNPLVVYHTTRAEFTVFDPAQMGKTTDTNASDNYIAATAHAGFWFNTQRLDSKGMGGNVMPVYLSAQRLYEAGTLDGLISDIWDAYTEDYDSEDPSIEDATAAGKYFRELLESRGYDGIVVDDTEFGGKSYVVFEPTQIKSATDNVGTFDPDNPDIRYSLRTPTQSDLVQEYLQNMTPTASMTESERWLLGKYQQTMRELQEKETAIEEQVKLAAEAREGSDERIKAENRAKVLRQQAARLRNTLRSAERANGFGNLMRTSERVVERFLGGEDMTRAGDVSDRLESEINELDRQLKDVAQRIQQSEAGQKTALARGMFDQQALTKAGRDVRSAFNTRMSGKAISDRLALAYAELYAGNGSQESGQQFAAVLRSLAQDVLRNSDNRYHSTTLDDLRENLQGSISLTEAQKQELKNAGISLSEFKRVMSSVANVNDNGTSLASIVSSAEYYQSGIISQLASTDSEGDMALRLYNLVSEEKSKERSNALEGMTEAESISYTMAEIVGMTNLPMSESTQAMTTLRNALLEGVEQNRTVSQKVDEALKTARSVRSSAYSLWRKTADVEQTARKAVDYYHAIEEQRRLLEEQEIVQQLQSDAVRKMRESRTLRELSTKASGKERSIRRVVKRMTDKLTHGTDYRNIPDELQGFVGEIGKIFSDGFGRMVFSKKQAEAFTTLYSQLNSENGPYAALTPFYDEDMLDTLHALSEWADRYADLRSDKSAQPLERAQTRLLMDEAVHDLVKHAEAMVNNATEMRVGSRKQQFADVAGNVINEMQERADRTTYQNKLGDAANWLERAIVTGNTTPVYFFDRLGNRQLKSMFKDFMRGQENWAFQSADAKSQIQQFKTTYGYDAWVDADALTFTTQQGHEISLTKEQALWLYATWKREHSNPIASTEHLTSGGFIYESGTQQKGKGWNRKAEITTGHRINAEDMKQVNAYLTKEEMGYADAVVNFLSTEVGGWGNKVSMELYGIRKFTERYYFPYATARDQRYQKSTAGGSSTTDDSRIKHSGFTHALTRSAKTTLVMGNFTDVVANHIGQMALYSSFTLPIENMNRILNYRYDTEDGGTTTIRSLIRQKYGSNTLNYMETFLRDMNGGLRGTDKSAAQKFVSLFKKSAVVASLSVSLQQTSAMLRAGAVMDFKYLLQTPANYKAEYEQLMEHSGVAIVKQMGRFDTNVGQSYNEWLLSPEDSSLTLWQKTKEAVNPKEWETFKQRWTNIATGLPNTMDEVAWGMLWKAVKSEQKALHPGTDTSSDAFLDMCGERFNDIATHTQVYDSTLTRSQLMRSTNAIDQMATAFRAEPTLTLNVLYDAFFNKNIPKAERRSRRISAVAAVLSSSAAAAIGSALISAWNKDDDDRTAAEKFVRKTNENFWDNVLPWYNIPYISDIISLIEGYDVERADMSLFSDVVDGFNKISKWRNGDVTTWRMVEDFGGSLANFLGIPAKNIMRDMRRIYNMMNTRWETPTQTGMEAALIPSFINYDDSVTAYYNRAVTAYKNGDTAKGEDIMEYLRTVQGKSDESIRKGFKADVEERFKAGSMTAEEGTALLMKVFPNDYEVEDLYWRFDELQAEVDGDDDYSKYDSYFAAVESGTNLKSETQRYLNNGVKKTTLASNLTKQYKAQLQALYKTNKTKAAELQARLLTAYELLGYDRETKLKDIKKWYDE